MNWKAIFIGSFIGFILVFYLGYFVELSLFAKLIFDTMAVLIAGLIAGIFSPEDAWKDGSRAGVFMFLSRFILAYLYVLYGLIDLPSNNLLGAVGGLSLGLFSDIIIGAIGGFAGGKLVRHLIYKD